MSERPVDEAIFEAVFEAAWVQNQGLQILAWGPPSCFSGGEMRSYLGEIFPTFFAFMTSKSLRQFVFRNSRWILFWWMQKGDRRRWSARKVPVFGLLKRGGRLSTQVIADATSDELAPICEKKVASGSVDFWRDYNTMETQVLRHFPDHHPTLFSGKKIAFMTSKTFGIRQFNGAPKEPFYPVLKECEWRFNNSSPKSS